MIVARAPKFLVDEMLGNVARWLRILGFDTVYAKEIPQVDDTKILIKALEENRWLVTRDRELFKRAVKYGVRAFYVEKLTEPEILLSEILKSFGIRRLPIDEESVVLRCTVCNAPLKKVERKEVVGKVPPGVLSLKTDFWICTRCGKVYWEGSHWKRILRVIDAVRRSLNESA